jgi:FtsH-binding integral membrane protein
MLKRKVNKNNAITMADFFASAFLRTGFMVFIAGGLGIVGRMLSYTVFTSQAMILGSFLLSILVIFGLNFSIERALYNGNIQQLGLLSYIAVSFLGLFTGLITAFYHVDLIAKALLTTTLVFGITATYGYLTNKDMSSLGSVLKILLFTSIGLSIAGLIISFFNPALASWFFSIESIISIVFNIIFIVFFIDMNKKIYTKYKNSAHQLQLMNIYASYIIFNRILDLFLNILYLLGKDDRKK